MKSIIFRRVVTLSGLLLFHSPLPAQVENYFAGTDAGVSITFGNYDTFVGYRSGFANTWGYSNTFLGSNTGRANTNGYTNTFVGAFAGSKNTTGVSNTFTGMNAGSQNLTSHCNSFYGAFAGLSVTTGGDNCIFGYRTGYLLQTGTSNVFVGTKAGYYTTSSHNTFIGTQAGEKNTTGTYNVFVGRSAGLANTSASSNTFIGGYAGTATTTGAYNTFVGTVAGDLNTTGSNNTFMGADAGGSNTTGARNAFYGNSAGFNNSSGVDNTFIGRESGRHNTTGTGNTAIGHYAQMSSGTLTNAVAIGNRAIVKASNSMVLGSINGENGATATMKVGIGTATPTYNLHVNGTAAKPGGGSWTAASDKRLKTDIEPYNEGLHEIDQINPVWFRYNGKAGLPTDKRFVGIIAQDMQKIAPHSVGEFSFENEEGESEKYLDYDPSALAYTLVNAVKELNKANKDFAAIVQRQEDEIKKLKEKIAMLEGRPSEVLYEGGTARLWQNAPNPYSSTTTIRYYVPEDVSDAEIRVISVTGQEVYSRQLIQKGDSQIEISNQILPTGGYVYLLIVNGNIVDNKKMILSR